jgi:hypothetical protein
MFCPRCQQDNPTRQKFCPNRLSSQKSQDVWLSED